MLEIRRFIPVLSLMMGLMLVAPVRADAVRDLEEQGLSVHSGPSAHFMAPRTTASRAGGVLLIVDSSADVVGMYDPYDGTYLGDLINGSGMFYTPINAILGPDGNVYVSDQVNDTVYVFDTQGNYLSVYADKANDGIDNIRGINFYNNELYVCSYYGYVARFNGPHSRMADFIYDGSSSLWDIVFLSGGDCLVSTSTADEVRHYDANGNLLGQVIPADFPEQLQEDTLLPGEYLVNTLTDKEVKDFDANGTIHQTTHHGQSGSGVYRLGNGNLLSAQGNGVYELDPGTGNIIQQKSSASGKYIEAMNLTSLEADTEQISEATGGVVNFDLDAGASHAGRIYVIFGGVTGSTPGTTLPGGVNLPVNWDVFTNIVLALVNTAPFSGFLGQLDTNGQATAKFDTLGPIPGTAGAAFTFAFALNKPWDFASNAVTVSVTP